MGCLRYLQGCKGERERGDEWGVREGDERGVRESEGV